jgi:hypothetical protein
MNRRLAQAQQRFENLNLRPLDPHTLDAFQQTLAVMLAQLVVQLALFALELAVKGLFHFLR